MRDEGGSRGRDGGREWRKEEGREGVKKVGGGKKKG